MFHQLCHAMKKSIYLISAVCCGLAACSHPSGHQEAIIEETENHGENIFHAHMEASSISCELTRKGQFGHIIRSIGQVLPAQGMEKTVIARTSGILSFEGRQVTEGQAVQAGQILFSVQSDGTAENNLSIRYKEAESNYSLAQAEYRRKEALAKDQIVSQAEVLRARRDLETAQARFANMKEHFPSGKQEVKAGLTGSVQAILVKEGDYVEEGQPLAIIVQSRSVLVKALVASRYFQQLKNVRTADFHPRNNSKTYSLDELEGRLLSYSQSVSADQPMLSVTFQISNEEGLLNGSFMDVYLRAESPEEVISVPNSALIEQMGSYFVFIRHSEDHFEKRAVQVGETDGKNSVILAGLEENESLVTKGAILLKLAQATGKLDPHEGHAH